MMDIDAVRDEIERESKVDSAANYLDKTKRIKKEVTRIKKLFREIDEDKKKLVYSTIEDVAFLVITMQDLRENIIREGTTVEYKNGANQFGTKQSPDAQLYLQMSQKHAQAIKILVDCLPKTERKKVQDDGFDDFVNNRGEI